MREEEREEGVFWINRYNPKTGPIGLSVTCTLSQPTHTHG